MKKTRYNFFHNRRYRCLNLKSPVQLSYLKFRVITTESFQSHWRGPFKYQGFTKLFSLKDHIKTYEPNYILSKKNLLTPLPILFYQKKWHLLIPTLLTNLLSKIVYVVKKIDWSKLNSESFIQSHRTSLIWKDLQYVFLNKSSLWNTYAPSFGYLCDESVRNL